MFLENLELNGFKSFAHKTTLAFKPGITAIVGPNGAGKSNLADAVRWVLGEQSIKLLRGKKSEDVIFSGSDKKSRLGLAGVSLYFNNEMAGAGRDRSKHPVDVLNLPSEICITRKLYRNGESEYLINKQKSRLADIQMLLAKAGIAHHSYAIIGQGMIETFLLASAQERKEFFEEASGVKPLQIKRGQSLNKLEHTEENLGAASIQLQEIKPRLNSLTRQVKRLERRTEIELKLKEVQQKYYGCLWYEIDKNWQIKHNELKKIIAEQEKKEKEVEKFQDKMAKLTKESAKSEEFEKLQDKYQKTLEEKVKLSEKLTTLKIKNAQVVPTKEQKSVPYLVGQEVINYLNALNVLNSQIKKSINEKKWDQIEKSFFQQENIIHKVTDILRPFAKGEKEESSQKDENKMEIESLKKQLQEIDVQIQKIQNQMKQENEKEKQERSQIWELQQKYQQEQAELTKISQEVNNLRVELARLETRKDDLEQEIRQELGDNWLSLNKRQLVDSPRLSSRLAEALAKRVDEAGASSSGKMSEEEKRTLITEIGKLKHQLDLIGGIDPEVQKEYREIKARYEFLSTQIEDLKKSIGSLEKLILKLDETIKKQFEASFKIINQEFQKYFKILFAGGRAKLTLIKEESRIKNQESMEDEIVETQPATSLEDKSEIDNIKDRLRSDNYAGVNIEATPPGKKLKSINMLSGGERALTSIALLCAILVANPSPFVFLDEVDAALDEANSIRFADILEKLSHKSQFIVVTHNRATMEKSDILYGVTMGDDGVSALLSLKLEGAKKYTNQ